MQVEIEAGTYILAVSGGVDSVVLLDLLASAGRKDVELIVAHYDHGIRTDSADDLRLVGRLAQHYGLPCVSEVGQLGPAASEALARDRRYAFLERTRRQYGARAIITAHHQDDVLETVILNLLRGTGRKGLTSLASTPNILRPMLCTPKRDILAYATTHDLRWHEDSTNADDRYLRNYIRHHVLARFDERARARVLEIIGEMRTCNRQIDAGLQGFLDDMANHSQLDRRQFMQLPYAMSCELLAAWLRSHGIRQFDSRTIARLVVAAKTLRPGSRADVVQGATLRIDKDSLALVMLER